MLLRLQLLLLLFSSTSPRPLNPPNPPHPLTDYTYFYKGRDYWKFDNQRLSVEPGYPRSILQDWMGCVGPEASGGRPGHGHPGEADVRVALEEGGAGVNALAAVLPCVLALCVLVLLYTIFQFKNKGALQDAATQSSYKYPVQEWV